MVIKAYYTDVYTQKNAKKIFKTKLKVSKIHKYDSLMGMTTHTFCRYTFLNQSNGIESKWTR